MTSLWRTDHFTGSSRLTLMASSLTQSLYKIFNRTTELLIYNAQSVKDILTLRWKSQSASLRNLQIVDMSGKIVLRKQIALNAGQNIVTLPAGHLANGIYVLNLIQDNNAESDFFIKK